MTCMNQTRAWASRPQQAAKPFHLEDYTPLSLKPNPAYFLDRLPPACLCLSNHANCEPAERSGSQRQRLLQVWTGWLAGCLSVCLPDAGSRRQPLCTMSWGSSQEVAAAPRHGYKTKVGALALYLMEGGRWWAGVTLVWPIASLGSLAPPTINVS
ncbi:hypothetical protein B0H63DRAFT_108961 [Podospora didyma]|uniref:Uncharacterized protein n=1 Tax=Podospora didyma TaxID=330526 RepID=A0AAE0NZF8_9PEZI|nr:hypothetical protein B0H63DRAFT_108961 [Podospora didyma]